MAMIVPSLLCAQFVARPERDPVSQGTGAGKCYVGKDALRAPPSSAYGLDFRAGIVYLVYMIAQGVRPCMISGSPMRAALTMKGISRVVACKFID